MKKIPEEVSKAWAERKGPVASSTVDKKGSPNSIIIHFKK